MAGALAYKYLDDEYSDAQEAPSLRDRPKVASRSENPTGILENPAHNEKVHVIPKVDIRAKGYKIMLRCPIAMYLETDNGQYIISHEESRVYGVGQDAAEALRDFDAAFVSVYRSYVHSEDPLSPGAEEYSHF